MKHSFSSFEKEIVDQILLAETCFMVAESIPGIPGPGLFPFLYNLSFTKGVDVLYGLLLYSGKNEISFRRYLSLCEERKSIHQIQEFREKISEISTDYKNLASYSIRNKIGSHYDADFTHSDFIQGYMLPGLIPPLKDIVKRLKNSFFPFANYSVTNGPNAMILEQTHKVIADQTGEFVKTKL